MADASNQEKPTLLETYLSRSNEATRAQYEAAINDFRAFLSLTDNEAAVDALLAAGFAGAERLVEDYRLHMVGEYDMGKKLIRGRGLSPSAVNLRLQGGSWYCETGPQSRPYRLGARRPKRQR